MNHTDEEFLPLPYFPWDERPATSLLDVEECATALYLEGGHLARAASRLKIDELRLKRFIKRHPRLVRLQDELYGVYVDRAAGRVIDALSADDTRVQWAAALKILSTKAAASHPFSPNGDGSPSLTINNDNREIVFKWRTEPLPLEDGGKVIDGNE
jgi:hypothetical protein